MNPPKYTAIDYINFLMGTQKAYSCTEAARVQPENSDEPLAYDAINRLLHRIKPSSQELWREAKAWIRLSSGILVIDDTTLDKWYATKMELVTRHWSGKHGRVVQGINKSDITVERWG